MLAVLSVLITEPSRAATRFLTAAVKKKRKTNTAGVIYSGGAAMLSRLYFQVSLNLIERKYFMCEFIGANSENNATVGQCIDKRRIGALREWYFRILLNGNCLCANTIERAKYM